MRLPVRNMPKILGEGSNLSRTITSKSYFEVILEIFSQQVPRNAVES